MKTLQIFPMNNWRTVSLLFLIQMILISCGSPAPETSPLKKRDSVYSGIDSAFLQGNWTSFNEQRDYSHSKMKGPELDSPDDNRPGILNWVIKGDSLWIFHYPCQFFGAHSYRLRYDSIYFDGNTRAECHINQLEAEGSDAFITDKPGDDKTPVISKKYYRDTFDLKTIEMLKHDSVDAKCLAGRMKLLQHVQPEDGEAYDIKFPIRLPEYVTIRDKNSAFDLYKKRVLLISINGKDKLFYVEEIGWNDYESDYVESYEMNKEKHYIILHPAEWWTGEPFTATYVSE